MGLHHNLGFIANNYHLRLLAVSNHFRLIAIFKSNLASMPLSNHFWLKYLFPINLGFKCLFQIIFHFGFKFRHLGSPFNIFALSEFQPHVGFFKINKSFFHSFRHFTTIPALSHFIFITRGSINHLHNDYTNHNLS